MVFLRLQSEYGCVPRVQTSHDSFVSKLFLCFSQYTNVFESLHTFYGTLSMSHLQLTMPPATFLTCLHPTAHRRKFATR